MMDLSITVSHKHQESIVQWVCHYHRL